MTALDLNDRCPVCGASDWQDTLAGRACHSCGAILSEYEGGEGGETIGSSDEDAIGPADGSD